MKKNVAITIISVLTVLAVALGVLYFANDADKSKQIDALNADVADKTGQVDTLTETVAEKAGQIEALTADTEEKAGLIETLNQDVSMRDGQIDTLNKLVEEKDKEIGTLNADVADKAGQIEALNTDITDKSGQIEVLTASVAQRDEQIGTLSADVTDKAGQIEVLKTDVTDKAGQIELLTASVAQRDEQIEALTSDVTDKAEQIEKLTASVAQKDEQIGTLSADVTDKAGQIDTLTASITEKDSQIKTLTENAAAKDESFEKLNGTWYINAVVFDGVSYDVSDSLNKTVLEFNEKQDGSLFCTAENWKKGFRWLKDASGNILIFYADQDNSITSLKITSADEALILSDDDVTYVADRTTPTGSGLIYGFWAEYTCEVPDDTAVDNDSLVETTMEIIRTRLDNKGFKNASVMRVGRDRIRVEIPELMDDSMLDLISASGILEFKDSSGKTFMTGDMLKTATYYYSDGDHQIAFILNDEGARLFADVTAANIGKTLSICLDGEQLIAPTVQSAIINGSGVINGLGSAERASSIIAKIQAPSLPMTLNLQDYNIVYDVRSAQAAAAALKAGREDATKVILKLGDTVITKEEVKAETQNQLDSMAYYYSLYGVIYDTTNPDNIAAAQEEAVSALKKDLALTAKAAELGVDKLSAEEEESVKTRAQESYDSAVEYVKTSMLQDSGLEGDELDKAAADKLTELGVSLDSYIEVETKSAIDDKLREYAIKDVAVTDEEIKVEYDSRVEKDKETYGENAGFWATAANNGTMLYYTPAGVRRVKQIFTKLKDEDQAAIDEAKQKQTDANTAVTTAQAKVDAAQETLDTEGIDEETRTKAEADLKAASEELEKASTDLDAAGKAVEDATNKAFENIAADADEILQQLKDGADWQTLMDEKNQDPGMKSNEKGYAVAAGMTGFDSAFVDAAMALEKPGDISDKIKGASYGYYIIRYESDETEGPVNLDDVKETISSSLLSTKQDDTYNTTVDQWVEDAGIEIDMNALKD